MIAQIQFAATLIAGLIAAYTDLKTGYIYDWITYPLIGLGIILSIFTQQWIGLVLGGAIYGIGLFAYNAGKMGGGDIKLLAGIALVQPVYEGMIFVLAVLLIAALSACAVLGVYYLGSFWRTKPTIQWSHPKKRRAFLLIAIVFAYLLFAMQRTILPVETALILGISLFLGVLFYAFEEEIKTYSFLKRIPLSELEEDEVLASEHLTEEERKHFGKKIPGLVGTEDIPSLEHKGFHTIPVYRNLPKFAPFILVGVIITYLFPQWLAEIVPAFL